MWEQFISLVDGSKLLVILILIILDLLLGIIVAVKEGTFQLSKIANFLNTSVLYFVGGYFVVGLFAAIEPKYASLVTASWVLLDATMVGFILGKLKKLGLPVPDKLS